MIINKLIGKRVFILLKSGHNYNGKVLGVDEDFIKILDKMNDVVIINKCFVSSMVVKNGT